MLLIKDIDDKDIIDKYTSPVGVDGPARVYIAHMEGFLTTECQFLACWFFTMGNSIEPVTLNLFLLFFCLAHISKTVSYTHLTLPTTPYV